MVFEVMTRASWFNGLSEARSLALLAVAAGGLFGVAALTSAASAQDASGQAASPFSSPVTIELNKLEKTDEGCRTYFVVKNPNEASLKSLFLEVISFKTDGIIGQRLAFEFGPLRPNKTSVRLFRLKDTNCGDIASLLVNRVLQCEDDSGKLDDCMSKISVSSKTDTDLMN